MSNNKQTAVEWLLATLEQNSIIDLDWVDSDAYYTIINEAKQMEKEQTIKFAIDYIDDDDIRDLTAEEYYNETYRNNNKN